MNKIQLKNLLEKGQIIPLVVVMFFVIIAMVVLIIDGGALMSSRRTAQAAADAGALAGAKRACLGNNDAKSVAENYATVNNRATSALATVVGKQVTVNATVAYPSFFAGIIGHPTLTTSAQATAGCYGVSGKGVVPVGWFCNPNNVPGAPFNAAYGCQMQTLSWRDKIAPMVGHPSLEIPIGDYLGNNPIPYSMVGANIVDSATKKIPPGQIYIIFDGDKICSVDVNGHNICDVIGDEKIDLQTGGNRGYLYLDNIEPNIQGYLDNPNISLKTHTWLSGKPGQNTSLIIKMDSDGFAGKVTMIPVFNYICPDTPQTCEVAAHTLPRPDGVDDISADRGSPYYHIVAFAPFYISCVSKSGDCPGYTIAKTIDSTLDNTGPIIEGYFLTDYDVSPDFTQDCSINLGDCVVSLTN